MYKFIVDGKWSTIDQAPTEPDRAGNINNVYHAPPKPKDATPRYEPPSTREPEIASVPAPKDQPVKDKTLVDKKEPSPPVEEKVTPSVPKIAPIPVVPANDTKPIDTPPVTDKPTTTVLPTPANLRAPLPIVPVNDANTVDKRPPAVEPPRDTDTPSTHTPPVNSPRKSSTGTSSSNTLPTEKKEEEKKETKPEVVKQPNGIVHVEDPAKQSPSTPTKARTPIIPATPTTPTTFPSPPVTPKKPHFSRSRSSSPSSSGSHTISRKSSFKKKRDSFISKVKHLFTPEKDKGHKKEKSHG